MGDVVIMVLNPSGFGYPQLVIVCGTALQTVCPSTECEHLLSAIDHPSSTVGSYAVKYLSLRPRAVSVHLNRNILFLFIFIAWV